jgi:hypothetical protein
MRKEHVMKTWIQTTKWGQTLAILLGISVAAVGCGGGGGGGGGLTRYEAGYQDGFFTDEEYYFGYDDSWLTDAALPILYDGDLIPFIDDDSYDAGFYDGIFDAYNDGYFVAYRYAFIIGFSEGYDNAYWSDYLDFLASDFHSEFLHGGMIDAYNDGFSEGRIFGAFDYEAFLSFDWLDAFLDWESGTDLYFKEVDKGTGEFGPVVLYGWGQNPHELVGVRGAEKSERPSQAIAMRKNGHTKGVDDSRVDIERVFSNEQIQQLDTNPLTNDRTERDLTLEQTWLERIEAYQQSSTINTKAKIKRHRD